ncbi:MAG: cation:proton antiporter [Proteobacteria bacterium]|nr:cation:proton antiporter [Pseudomonadota bacterium]
MEDTIVVVLGLTGLLAITSLLLPVARRLNFPFTVLLAAVGVVFGFAVNVLKGTEGLWILGDFVTALDNFSITSEAVFFLFLPALVFESALSIDVRKLLDDIAPILLLAIVGLLISTFAVAGAVYPFAGTTFVVCLLLGAIVSATDPVAVVAIFKDLGAPKRLAILVEGESLFNDATAIVMFTILLGMIVSGAEADLVGGGLEFLKVFVGGIVVGYLFARGLCWVIGRMHGMPLVEITLTVCLAYLSFLIAEHYLHVSGVMAVVTAALVVGSYGRTTISPETWHPLTETWEQLGFWANSLIFILVGLAVPEILSGFTLSQFGLLVVVLVAAFAARAAILYGLLPVFGLAGLSDKVSKEYTTVMFWGGLRGAVSLALALAIFENTALDSGVRSFVVVLVTGFVLFTLFVNATTMGPLMSWLGLDKLSAADLDVRNRVLARSLADVRDELQGVARDYQIEPELAQDVAGQYDDRLAEIEAERAGAEGLSDADRVRTGLTTLINDERKLYLKQFNQGFVSPSIARRLFAQADTVLDGIKTGGVEGHEAAVQKTLGFSGAFEVALRLQRHLGWTGPLAAALADRFDMLLVTRTVLREMKAHSREKIVPLFGEDTGNALDALLEERLAATGQQLDALRLQYPEYADTLQTRLLERVALRLEAADYGSLADQAVISQDVYKDLQSGLAARNDALRERPPLDLGLEPEKLVQKVPYFSDLDAGRIAEIAGLLKPRLVLPGELVVHKGDPGDAMYFVSTGAVEVDIQPEPVRLGSGDFFGEIALLKEQPRIADVTALTYCQVLALFVRDFRTLLDANPELRERITRVAEERLAADSD